MSLNLNKPDHLQNSMRSVNKQKIRRSTKPAIGAVTQNGRQSFMSSAMDTKRSDFSNQHKSQFDGEFNIVYGNPLSGRKDSEYLIEQSNFK